MVENDNSELVGELIQATIDLGTVVEERDAELEEIKCKSALAASQIAQRLEEIATRERYVLQREREIAQREDYCAEYETESQLRDDFVRKREEALEKREKSMAEKMKDMEKRTEHLMNEVMKAQASRQTLSETMGQVEVMADAVEKRGGDVQKELEKAKVLFSIVKRGIEIVSRANNKTDSLHVYLRKELEPVVGQMLALQEQDKIWTEQMLEYVEQFQLRK